MDFLKASDEEILKIFNKESNFFHYYNSFYYARFDNKMNYCVKEKEYTITFNKYRILISRIVNDFDFIIEEFINNKWIEVTNDEKFNILRESIYWKDVLKCFIIKSEKFHDICKIIRFVYKLDKLNIFS